MLPNSQLDRFLIRISMGYPDFSSEVNILRERRTENPLDRATAVLKPGQLEDLIHQAQQVEIRDSVYEYVTHLAQATREHSLVELGLSPRGSLAVCRMAKSYAFLHGRDYVVPEDVAAIFPDVCCHRLMLGVKARMMEETAQNIVAGILKQVDMPVLKKG